LPLLDSPHAHRAPIGEVPPNEHFISLGAR
jgi:hypothetical protein